jgi:2-(1,2-epoxy-1,2-dihydrophenyl)acetyl-CoA isomerase
MSYEQITTERDGAVAVITLNRPEKLNALTQVMSDELVDAFQTVQGDDGLRAVILTGAGRGFCAGQDLTEFEEAYRGGSRPDIEEHLARTYHQLIPVMVSTPAPVIAGVNGVAAGAGLSLALACDVRVAHGDARFTQAFVKIGLVPDSGGTFLLPRVVGFAKAMELSITGDAIDAEEAHRIGLVSRVFPGEEFEDELRALGRRLAALPTTAIAETKTLLREAWSADLATALAAEATAQARMGATDDHLEGVMAFAQKREPTFQGR